VIHWSASSWSLWKSCPAKYRVRIVEKWQPPEWREDSEFAKLAIPGLVVDKMLQLWLHRKMFHDMRWLSENIRMLWSIVLSEVNPKWVSDEEVQVVKDETWRGLQTAIRMLEKLDLAKYDLRIQPRFFEKITDEFSITGSADLVMVEKHSDAAIVIDIKNAHRRERITKDQLIIYQIGLNLKSPLNIIRSGYLMFNPRLEEWKWFKLNKGHEDRLIEKLAAAAKDVMARSFEYKWNHFTCSHFCEVRYSCEMFQQVMSLKAEINPSPNSKRFILRVNS
jgi:hypothetical protein